jgi:hypothetical protein
VSWHELPVDLPCPDGLGFVGRSRLYRCLECDWLTPRADLLCPEHGKSMAFIGWMEGSGAVNGRPVPKHAAVRFPEQDSSERQQAALRLLNGGKKA